MSTVTPPATDISTDKQSFTVWDILSHATPLYWTTGLLRASSQILALSVAVEAVRSNVKDSRVSMALRVAAITAPILYRRRHKTPLIKKAFLKEFGITLEGPGLKFTDFTKARKDAGFPVIASADGVRGIYTLHEKDDQITVTDPAGVTVQRLSR